MSLAYKWYVEEVPRRPSWWQKKHQWCQHRDQSKWTEAWDCHKLQVPGLSYNWWRFQVWNAHQNSTENSSINKIETSLDWQEYFSQFRTKVRLMRSLVTSIFLYACESWTLTAELQRRIQAIEMRSYRKILLISYKDQESQTAVVWSCLPFIRSGQNHLAGHSERVKKTR